MKRSERLLLQQQVGIIQNCIDNLPAYKWADNSDSWGTGERIAALTYYNVEDFIFVPFDSPERKVMQGLTSKEYLFPFILKNLKRFCSSERFSTGVSYDCSGKCIGRNQRIKKLDGYTILIVQSSSYDI